MAPTKPVDTESKVPPEKKPKLGADDAPIMMEVETLDSHENIIKETKTIRAKLFTEWNKGANRSDANIDDMLEEAKVLLTKMKYLPMGKTTPEDELIIARDILELGVKASATKIAKQSNDGIAEFDRYMAQLKHYYFDLRKSFNKDSESMYEILGMNLLKLLSQDRIAEFHIELELFVHSDFKGVMNNVYIKKAVEIEQFLNEGRYNKILALHTASDDDLKRAGLKSSGFRFFIEKVVENSRDVIADVIQKAYYRLHKDFAEKSVHGTKDPQVLVKMAEKRNWSIRQDGYVYFTSKKSAEETLPSVELASDFLAYAKELDTIV